MGIVRNYDIMEYNPMQSERGPGNIIDFKLTCKSSSKEKREIERGWACIWVWKTWDDCKGGCEVNRERDELVRAHDSGYNALYDRQ